MEEQKDLDPIKSMQDSFSKELERIASGVSSIQKEMEGVKNESKSLKTKLEDVDFKPRSEKEDPFDSDLLGIDPAKIERLVDKKLDQRINTLEHQTAEEKLYLQECNEWDAKAYEEFKDDNQPLLKNPEFEKATKEELAKTRPIKIKEGKEVYAPDAVFNAASRVYARWMKNGLVGGNMPYEASDFGSYGNKRQSGSSAPHHVQSERLRIMERIGIPKGKEQRFVDAFKRYDQKVKEESKQKRAY